MPVALTVNVPGTAVVPAALVTLTDPVAAPGITIAVNELADWLSMMAALPPTLTDWAEVKSVPERVNSVPTAPDAGENDTTAAAGAAAVVPPPPPPPQAVKNKARPAAMHNSKLLLMIFMLFPLWK